LGLSINLTPSVPLSFKGEGEDYKRGAKPLLDTLSDLTYFKGGGGNGYVREAKPLFDSPYSGKVIRGVLEGRSHMIRRVHIIIIFPLLRGRGIKGDGVD